MSRTQRIFLCAAFEPGCEVAQYIAERFASTLVGAATCDRDDSAYEQRIATDLAATGIDVERKVDLNAPDFGQHLRALDVDLVLLAWIPTIIKPHQLPAARTGWVNMHPALLPWGRGKHGYYWACVEGTPFGATLHLIDDKIDAGRVLWQTPLEVTPCDTGETLYRRSVQATIDLVRQHYQDMANGDFTPMTPSQEGTFHWARELDPHSCIDLDRHYRGEDLLNILRGRSFSHGPSAYFLKDDRKYYVRVSIEEAPTPGTGGASNA